MKEFKLSDTTSKPESSSDRAAGWVMFSLLFFGSIGFGFSFGFGAGVGAFCLTLFLELGIEWAVDKLARKLKGQ